MDDIAKKMGESDKILSYSNSFEIGEEPLSKEERLSGKPNLGYQLESIQSENEDLALRLRSMTEKLSLVTETYTKLESQLLELKKENREYKEMVMDRLKALEENRYARR